MSLGGVSDPDLVGTAQLHNLATELRIRPTVVIGEAGKLIEQISEGLPETAAQFADRFGDSPVLERLPIILRKQIRRLQTQLK